MKPTESMKEIKALNAMKLANQIIRYQAHFARSRLIWWGVKFERI